MATSGPSCDGSGAVKASVATRHTKMASINNDAPQPLNVSSPRKTLALSSPRRRGPIRRVQAMWQRFRTMEALRSMGPRFRGDDNKYSAACIRRLLRIVIALGRPQAPPLLRRLLHVFDRARDHGRPGAELAQRLP